MIAALEKAESLHRFVLSQGAPLNTFQLALSDREGLEVLDWLQEQYDNELLDSDIAIARATGDAWKVLDGFTLLGFAIVRASRVLN